MTDVVAITAVDGPMPLLAPTPDAPGSTTARPQEVPSTTDVVAITEVQEPMQLSAPLTATSVLMVLDAPEPTPLRPEDVPSMSGPVVIDSTLATPAEPPQVNIIPATPQQSQEKVSQPVPQDSAPLPPSSSPLEARLPSGSGEPSTIPASDPSSSSSVPAPSPSLLAVNTEQSRSLSPHSRSRGPSPGPIRRSARLHTPVPEEGQPMDVDK